MPQYEVTIKAIIVKKVTVFADDEETAVEIAEEGFDSAYDGTVERYEQDVEDVKEV